MVFGNLFHLVVTYFMKAICLLFGRRRRTRRHRSLCFFREFIYSVSVLIIFFRLIFRLVHSFEHNFRMQFLCNLLIASTMFFFFFFFVFLIFLFIFSSSPLCIVCVCAPVFNILFIPFHLVAKKMFF